MSYPPGSPASHAAAAEAPPQHPCRPNIVFDFLCLLLLCLFPFPLVLLSDLPLPGFHKTQQNRFILHLEQKSCDIILVMTIIIPYQTSVLQGGYKSCMHMRFDPIYVSMCMSWYVVIFQTIACTERRAVIDANKRSQRRLDLDLVADCIWHPRLYLEPCGHDPTRDREERRFMVWVVRHMPNEATRCDLDWTEVDSYRFRLLQLLDLSLQAGDFNVLRAILRVELELRDLRFEVVDCVL